MSPTRTISVIGGNWDSLLAWDEAAVPTAADNVVARAGGTSGALTVNVAAACRSMVLTGYTNTLTINAALSIGDASGGALTLVAGMTVTAGASGVVNLVATSDNGGAGWGITTAGKALPATTFAGVGGKWVLVDDLTLSGGANPLFTITGGAFDSGNRNISAARFVMSGASVRSATLGTSTITLIAAGAVTIWNITGSNVTVSAASATIVIGSTSVNTRTFAGNGNTYGTLTYTFAGSTGSLVITGVNTFGTINFSDVTNARTLTLPTATTTTITTAFNVNGTAGKLMTVTGDVAKTSGVVRCEYLSLSSSDATGGATWIARNSTDGGSNTGWFFGDIVFGSQASTTVSANGGAILLTLSGSLAETTSSANGGTPALALPGAQATTTSTANTGTPALVLGGGQAGDTSDGSTGSLLVIIGGGQAGEANSGNGGGTLFVVLGALVDETDEANGGTPLATVSGSQAQETDTTGDGSPLVVLPGSLADETDTANAGSPFTGLIVAGSQAGESNDANAGSAYVLLAGAQAPETSTGLSGALSVILGGSQATSANTGHAGLVLALVAGGLALETDTANGGTAGLGEEAGCVTLGIVIHDSVSASIAGDLVTVSIGIDAVTAELVECP